MRDPLFIVAPDVGNAPVLSTTFESPVAVQSAPLRIVSLGIHEVWLNGRRAETALLAPGWTSYDKRLVERTIMIGPIAAGANTLSVVLGNGWYRGALTWARVAAYGTRLALRAELVVPTNDGTLTVVTDKTWVAHASNIVSDDLYDGQLTDLRIPTLGHGNRPVPVTDIIDTVARIDPQQSPDVRITEERAPLRIERRTNGRFLIDFGQNLVGTVRLTGVRGKAGDSVRVRHSEVLDAGELATEPLRSARATDEYLLGSGANDLESRFTFHGFRYAEVEGLSNLEGIRVSALVIGSDLDRTGWFETSDSRLARLHDNAVWSARGNFVSIPTDCPQRDERLGWTGDISVFTPTAAQLFDVQGFLASWLRDLAVDQHESGAVPYVIPDVLRTVHPAAAGWGDAAVTVPWDLYLHYGSIAVLEDQYDSMTAWVDHIHSLAGLSRIWQGGLQFGDWVDPQAPPHDPALAQADPTLVATAQSYRTTVLMARSAEAIGRHHDSARYAAIAEDIRQAFLHRFVTPAGLMTSDSQTSYALAIHWGLLRDKQAIGAGQRLVELVISALFRVDTGFLGTATILSALSDVGADWVAERMLLEESMPSWLYPVNLGATTIWERWDSMLPDGSINPGEMTSFNHYALGAVCAWMHGNLAGLAPTAPGYSSIDVRPVLTGRLESAAHRIRTPHGDAEVRWTYRDGVRELTVRVPDGVAARINRLDGSALEVIGGEHEVVEQWRPPTPPAERAVSEWVSVDALQRALTAALVECGVAESTTKVLFALEAIADRPVSAVLELIAAEDRPRVAALLADLNEAWTRFCAASE